MKIKQQEIYNSIQEKIHKLEMDRNRLCEENSFIPLMGDIVQRLSNGKEYFVLQQDEELIFYPIEEGVSCGGIYYIEKNDDHILLMHNGVEYAMGKIKNGFLFNLLSKKYEYKIQCCRCCHCYRKWSH